MSLPTITRIRPADLQQVQAQTTTNAAISDVIASLQSNVSTELAPLNTHCPTCMVSDVSQGFVDFVFEGNTFKITCPTCKGYLLYHTSGGTVTPPTNPFGSQLVVYRLLPADLREALNGFPSATTLDTMITSLQGNFDTPPTNNCPQCTHTGWITVQTQNILCPLCLGYQKTVQEYTLTNGRYVVVYPTPPIPDPPLPQPVPPVS